MSSNNEILKWDGDMHHKHQWIPNFWKPGNRYGMTDEVLEKLYQEKDYNFIPVENSEPPKLGKEVMQLVATGKMVCPNCNDSRQYWRHSVGSVTGVEVQVPATCSCVSAREYYRYWHDDKSMPEMNRACTVRATLQGKLRPFFTNASDRDYYTLCALLYAFPNYSVMLSGNHSTGKTTYLSVLYEYAVRQTVEVNGGRLYPTPNLWKTKALKLAEEYRLYVTQKTDYDARRRQGDMDTPPPPRPLVDEDKVKAAKAAGHIPGVFLDEFDKFKATEFQYNNFFQVTDAIYETGGQIVCTTNLSFKDIVARYGNGDNGRALLRRIVGVPRGIFIDTYANKVYVNTIPHHLAWDAETGYSLKPDMDPRTWMNIGVTYIDHKAPEQNEIPWTRFMDESWHKGPPANAGSYQSSKAPAYTKLPAQPARTTNLPPRTQSSPKTVVEGTPMVPNKRTGFRLEPVRAKGYNSDSD